MKKYVIENKNTTEEYVSENNLFTHNIQSAKFFNRKKDAKKYVETNKLEFHLGTKLFTTKINISLF